MSKILQRINDKLAVAKTLANKREMEWRDAESELARARAVVDAIEDVIVAIKAEEESDKK